MWPFSNPPPPKPPEREPVNPELFRRTEELPTLDLPIPPPTEDQYEDLLNTVWRCEHTADLERRIEQAIRIDEARERRKERERAGHDAARATRPPEG